MDEIGIENIEEIVDKSKKPRVVTPQQMAIRKYKAISVDILKSEDAIVTIGKFRDMFLDEEFNAIIDLAAVMQVEFKNASREYSPEYYTGRAAIQATIRNAKARMEALKEAEEAKRVKDTEQ